MRPEQIDRQTVNLIFPKYHGRDNNHALVLVLRYWSRDEVRYLADKLQNITDGKYSNKEQQKLSHDLGQPVRFVNQILTMMLFLNTQIYTLAMHAH